MVSRDKLINDLRELHEQLLVDTKETDVNYTSPTQEQMNMFGAWSAQTYYREFGSWNKALECAGLQVNQCYNPDKDTLIDDLKDFSDKVDGSPTAAEMDEFGPHSSLTYHVNFGSWNDALNRAGIECNREFADRESLLNELQSVSEVVSGVPSVSDMDEHGKWSRKPYESEFGSWNNALREAGIEPIHDYPLTSNWSEHTDDYYGKSWKEMRNRVRNRDDFQCRVCESDDRIQVHHIKTRRLFENPDKSNSMDNLITLCVSCHGKFERRWIECDHNEFEEKAKNVRR